MQKIKIHPEGPALSRLVVGVWRWHTVSAQHVEVLIKTSIASGITSFDHADIYGNYSCEEIFGNALRGSSSLRNEMEIVTKCGIKLLSDKRLDHLKNRISAMVWSPLGGGKYFENLINYNVNIIYCF